MRKKTEPKYYFTYSLKKIKIAIAEENNAITGEQKKSLSPFWRLPSSLCVLCASA